MQKINKQSIFNIILGLSGLIVLGLIFFIVLTVKDIKTISNDIHKNRTDLELKYQSGLLLRENIQKLVEVKPTIKSLEESFIDHSDTLVFVNDIETEAEKLGIKQIINIPETELETAKITTSAIQLTLTGQPENILKYLNILDAKPYYINIADINITNSNNQPNEIQKNIQVIINGTIYWK